MEVIFSCSLMEMTTSIMRRSIFIFLKHFDYFINTSVLLMLPFSASVLLSHALFGSSHLPLISLQASGFSSSSSIFTMLFNQNYIFFLGVVTPFALSSLLIAKASVIQAVMNQNPPFSSCLSLYKPLLQTHLCNMSLNIAAIFLFLAFSSTLPSFGLSHTFFQTLGGLVFYAFQSNTSVLFNLALVETGMENSTGYTAAYKACLERRKTISMALLLALPTNLGLASVKALFSYRLVGSWPSLSMAIEGMFIAYIYSIIIALDTIFSSLLLKSCRSNSRSDQANEFCNQIELV
ncbi:hypothetical protein UlMin_014681 [Ulmus minor]